MPAHSQLKASANGYYCGITAVVVGHWFTVYFMRVGVEGWSFCLLPTAGSHGVFRFFCPWNTPGKNTGVGCHSLLQGIFPTQGLHLSRLCCREILNHLSYQGSPFVYHFPNLWPLWGKILRELSNMDMLPCKAILVAVAVEDFIHIVAHFPQKSSTPTSGKGTLYPSANPGLQAPSVCHASCNRFDAVASNSSQQRPAPGMLIARQLHKDS